MGDVEELGRVSLINCWTNTYAPSTTYRVKERTHSFYSWDGIHPQYVIFGGQHIANTDEKITEVWFLIDDATILFYDYKNLRPRVDKLISTEVFSSETVVGKVSAHHGYYRTGGSSDIATYNTTRVRIEFSSPIAFKEVVDRVQKVLRFLELIVGRTQNLLEFTIGIESGPERPEFLEVYSCVDTKHQRSEHPPEQPHPSDVLINAVQDPDAFSKVLSTWLERSCDSRWRDARWRFFSFFEKQYFYDWPRLISARDMFNCLLERNSRNNLRDRADILTKKIGNQLPDLHKVINEAVKCRDFYVHGNKPDHKKNPKRVIDYKNNLDVLVFFTMTLEFVFATSDLVEAGWDIEDYCKTGSHQTHPFGRYLLSYSNWLKEFKAL